jgi:hypothetical protein
MHLGWREEGVEGISKKIRPGSRWVLLLPGFATPQEYDWHSQEVAAIYTGASVKSALARVSCYVKGAAPVGESSHCKYVALELKGIVTASS